MAEMAGAGVRNSIHGNGIAVKPPKYRSCKM